MTTVYIEVTAQQTLQGKQYSRGFRGLKLAQNALTRLFTHSMCHHWPQLKEGKCFQCRRQTIAEWCWSFFCNAEQIVGDVKAWLLNSRGTIPKTFYTKWSNSGIMAENNHRLAPTRVRSCMPQTFCFNCWEQNKKGTLNFISVQLRKQFLGNVQQRETFMPYFFISIWHEQTGTTTASIYQHLKNGGFVIRRWEMVTPLSGLWETGSVSGLLMPKIWKSFDLAS